MGLSTVGNWRRSLGGLGILIIASDTIQIGMEMIEKIRRKTLYEHPPADCVEECKERGDNDA